MATLERLYEMDIQFFGRVNFTSLINIVDALGGLEVVSDEEFDTGWESGAMIHVNEGVNYFDGTSALAFCRERHALEDGDNARGRHQQAVITAMIKIPTLPWSRFSLWLRHSSERIRNGISILCQQRDMVINRPAIHLETHRFTLRYRTSSL